MLSQAEVAAVAEAVDRYRAAEAELAARPVRPAARRSSGGWLPGGDGGDRDGGDRDGGGRGGRGLRRRPRAVGVDAGFPRRRPGRQPGACRAGDPPAAGRSRAVPPADAGSPAVAGAARATPAGGDRRRAGGPRCHRGRAYPRADHGVRRGDGDPAGLPSPRSRQPVSRRRCAEPAGGEALARPAATGRPRSGAGLLRRHRRGDRAGHRGPAGQTPGRSTRRAGRGRRRRLLRPAPTTDHRPVPAGKCWSCPPTARASSCAPRRCARPPPKPQHPPPRSCPRGCPRARNATANAWPRSAPSTTPTRSCASPPTSSPAARTPNRTPTPSNRPRPRSRRTSG